MKAVQRALIGLMIAFTLATTIATVTTIKQIRMATSSASHPATRV
jgi:hypothetical protein